MKPSIFQTYYNPELFQDRYPTDSARAVDVVIPIIHTNELWERNLVSIYREIPVRRLLISDGGCKDDSLDIARRFPRVEILDHSSYVSLGYCLRVLIQSVETDWFVYLHSDVYLPPGWFDAMAAHQADYDWFGCPQQITAMIEYRHVDSMAGLRRPYAGSQMGRKAAFVEGLKHIEDDYVYRQEDLVLLDVVERQGYRHGFVDDMFHYHQVMHKESPWSRKLVAVKVAVEWSREEEIRAAEMQAKGVVKYLRPSLALAIEVETQLLRLVKLKATTISEFTTWVRSTNPEWATWIKPWRIRLMRLSATVQPLVRKAYSFLRGG